uniref:CPG4 domain-containing protein n=1 Tax=Angiostrongylus cantonensis TaxID=6313 RepID=A0A158PA55_ANGCA
MVLNVLLLIEISGLIFATLRPQPKEQFSVSNETLPEFGSFLRLPNSLAQDLDDLKKGTGLNEPVTNVMKDLKASPLSSPLNNDPVVDENEPHPFRRMRQTGEELALELPVCQRECLKSLYDIVAKTVKKSTYLEKYSTICRAFEETTLCAEEESRRCGESDEVFNVISSGIHYMCIEQRNGQLLRQLGPATPAGSFDEAAIHLEPVVENAAGELLKQLLPATPIRSFGEAPVPLEPVVENGPDTSVECMFTLKLQKHTVTLSCFSEALDQKDYRAPVMVMVIEALVRPLVAGHQKFSLLFTAFGFIAPESCSFLYKGAILSQHRIDPRVHEELLTKFSRTDENSTSENTHGVRDSKGAVDVSDLHLVDADSDLEQLINLLYANETFDKAAAVDDTFLADDDVIQLSPDPFVGPINITDEPLFKNALTEGADVFGEVIFKQSLPAGANLDYDSSQPEQQIASHAEAFIIVLEDSLTKFLASK